MGSHGGCKMSEKEEEETERFFNCRDLQLVIFGAMKKETKILFLHRDSSCSQTTRGWQKSIKK